MGLANATHNEELANSVRPKAAAKSLAILDERDLFRQGIESILTARGDFDIVGSFSSFAEAEAKMRLLKPSVVIVGPSRHHDLSGVCKTLGTFDPAPKVLLLASSSADREVLEAFRCGANGCLYTDFRAQDLLDAIQLLCQGQTIIPDSVARQALNKPATDASSFSGLSIRELEVLNLMAQGLGNRDIADHLIISEKTVKTHVSHILRKLEVSNRTSAIVKASEEGWISIGPS